MQDTKKRPANDRPVNETPERVVDQPGTEVDEPTVPETEGQK